VSLPLVDMAACLVQARCEIESSVFHLRDSSTKFIVDDPLDSLVLLIRVIPSIRLGDGNEGGSVKNALERVVMDSKLTEPTVLSDGLHGIVDVIQPFRPWASKCLSDPLLEGLLTPRNDFGPNEGERTTRLD
jgi:hypothetical protein